MFNPTHSPSPFTGNDTQDRNRPQLSYSTSQPSSHGSPFSLSSLAGSTSTHHPHGSSPWASTTPTGQLPTSLSEPFLQSRSHYQSGYLMTMSQNNVRTIVIRRGTSSLKQFPQISPQSSQRQDELPVVQTKAKLNQALTRGSTSEFGKDPMFESSRQRQTMDEDAPPIASVNDIVNATYTESPPTYNRRVRTIFEWVSSSNTFLPRSSQAASPTSEPIYVVVFGYPPDKYSVAVEYFKQIGDTTDPEPNTEIMNCFRIGYKQPTDAMWAVRKNGEIINGSWMVGVRWANPSQADTLMGQSVSRNVIATPHSPDLQNQSGGTPESMAVDESHSPASGFGHRQSQSHPSATSVGTPIRLAPSASAFRRPGSGRSHDGAPQSQITTPHAMMNGTPGVTGQSPSKGMLGQVSDLIFGWYTAKELSVESVGRSSASDVRGRECVTSNCSLPALFHLLSSVPNMSQRRTSAKGLPKEANPGEKSDDKSNGDATPKAHPKQKVASGVVDRAFVVATSLLDYSFIVTLVLGGCCSNVWAYEALLRMEPRIGSALTFCQMLFITLQQLPSHLSWTPLPRLKPRQVPLSRWLLQVIVFATGSLLNNWVYAFHVPLTVQIVFRSAGLAVSMLFGRLLLKKQYSFRQVLAVTLVSSGVILATLSRPSPKAASASPLSGENVSQYALGIAMLTASLFFTGILGILQEQTYQKYGPCWREGVFYTHALSLPAFLFLIPQVKYGLNSLSEASNGDIPLPYLILAGNLLSQLVCVSGVNQLTSRISSVSTQVVLTTRKAISLVFSVWWFGSGWNIQLGMGASMVFIGSLWYTRINAVVQTLSEGATPYSSPTIQTPSKFTPGKRV
ncbi:hypothetical protein EVG20_g1005 [Dentipellis fragilis]|uniref:RRM Nup35-type domain-containing protein n=1 Tax=Dentipellis fragilis TaxID=205917 RepID=A0A4Y9ZDS7_9AGAM|nr:hypothetical protein EVG20_g1005 [Dentipellis fragilis]